MMVNTMRGLFAGVALSPMAGAPLASAKMQLCVTVDLNGGGARAANTKFRVVQGSLKRIPIPSAGGMCLQINAGEGAEIEKNESGRGWRVVCSVEPGNYSVVWMGGPRCSRTAPRGTPLN